MVISFGLFFFTKNLASLMKWTTISSHSHNNNRHKKD